MDSPRTGLKSAAGGAADVNGNGVLEPGEFLPDLNENGSVGVNSNDNFDNRSATEIGDNLVTGSGFTDNGSSGSKWTDISLSPTAPSDGFPDGNPAVPNQASFKFDFKVGSADIVAGNPLLFKLVMGEHGYADHRQPAKIRFSRGAV